MRCSLCQTSGHKVTASRVCEPCEKLAPELGKAVAATIRKALPDAPGMKLPGFELACGRAAITIAAAGGWPQIAAPAQIRGAATAEVTPGPGRKQEG